MSRISKGFNAIEWREFELSFEKASEFGFDHVEVRQPLDLPADDVVALAKENGVEMTVHLQCRPKRSVCIGSADDDLRRDAVAHVEGCIEEAVDLGAQKGVLHVETDDETPHLADEDETALFETLESLDSHARSVGFELCVENLPGRYPSLADFPPLFDHTSVSMTLDTGHARVNGYEAPEMAAFVAEHHDRIGHLHLNDTRSANDEHLPFGDGTIDFERIFRSLRQNGWSETVTTEIHTEDFADIGRSKQNLDALL